MARKKSSTTRVEGEGNVREEMFNKALGEALRSTNSQWREDASLVKTERSDVLAGPYNSGKHPDILILDPRSPPSVIECSYDPKDADNDAKARLGAETKKGRRVIKTCISLHIPKKFKSEEATKDILLTGAGFGFAIYQKTNGGLRRWPKAGFLTGDVWSLATLISAAALPKEDIESVADEVAALVNDAAGLLEALPDSTKQEIDDLINRGSVMDSLKTTMVLWLNALLTQQRLHGQGVRGIPALDFTGEEPPRHTATVDIWRKIYKKNWRAIFRRAIDIIVMAGNSNPRGVSEALSRLLEAAEKIEVAGLGLHINVGAELFPKLSEDRNEAAAFYTQASTAELLAALTIRKDDLTEDEWADRKLFTKRRLADMACGTGTLLRAGYRRVQALHEVSAKGSRVDIASLHKDAMETGLIGTDVSPIAAHLTSSSLAAIGTGKPYGKTQTGWVKVGGARDAIGSLDYFDNSELDDMLDVIAGSSSGDNDNDSEAAVRIPNGFIDWILMNPPYSRTRKGQSAFDIAGLTKAERISCQKKWEKAVKDEPVNRKAGMAASFLALARKKVKPGGRIGFVLPLTAAFADTWAVTRRMIEREFTEITALVVSAGQALHRDALSADTGMEEMILIATRHKKAVTKHTPINCVTLNDPVTRPGEAGELARAISHAIGSAGKPGSSRPIMAGDSEIGQVFVFDAGGEGAPWGPLGVTHTGLAAAADNLASGKLDFIGKSAKLGVCMTTLKGLFDIGPTHHNIGHVSGKVAIGAFEFYDITNPKDAVGANRALWAANKNKQRSLVVLPTHKGFPVKGKNHSEILASQSTLFYARNMRWTTQALLAATTKHSAMGGSSWTALTHDDIRVCRAFALWANSTLGMMVHWTQGQRTHAGRSRTQIGALKQIPCPKLDDLPDAELDFAAKKFDELASLQLSPAYEADIDKERWKIDSATISMLGLPDDAIDAVAELRYLWCREPSVRDKK